MLLRTVRRLRQALFLLNVGVPAVSIEDLVGSSSTTELVLSDWAKDRGAGSLWDLVAVCLLARSRSPGICFEIGTGEGRTALHLALNTPSETKVYTLDVSVHPDTGSIFRKHAEASKITRLTGDSQVMDLSSYYQTVDLVFVDGAHDYEAVSSDTRLAFSLLSPGGCVIWDDLAPGWPGVVRAVREWSRNNPIRRIAGTKLAFYERPLV